MYLDLVRVHAGVGDQDLDILHLLGLVDSDLLVQQETWTKQMPRLAEPSGKQIKELTFHNIARLHLRPGRSR